MNLALETYGNYVKSFLGPNKSNKFVIDDDQVEIICCSEELLSKLTYKHPIGYVVNSAIQSHYDQFGCGSTTLLAMFVFWFREIQLISEQVSNLSPIIRELKTALDNLICFVQTKSFTLHEFVSSKQLSREGIITNSCVKTLIKDGTQNSTTDSDVLQLSSSKLPESSKSVARILLSSRHFSLNHSEEIPQNSSEINNPSCSVQGRKSTFIYAETNQNEIDNISNSLNQTLKHVVYGLCHCWEDLTDILHTAWIRQIENSSSCVPSDSLRFTTRFLNAVAVTRKLPQCIVDGIILEVPPKIIPFLSTKKQFNNTLILFGSLEPGYRHLGFSSVKARQVQTSHSFNCAWTEKVSSILTQLRIDLVLTQGKVEDKLYDFCISNDIIILDRLKPTLLKKLTEVTNIKGLNYITDATKANVIEDLVVEVYHEDKIKNNNLILLKGDFYFQTAIIYSQVSCQAQLKLHQFWHFSKKLEHASVQQRNVLFGGTTIEQLCYKWCQDEIPKTKDLKIHYQILSKGLEDYIITVKENCRLDLDDHESQTETVHNFLLDNFDTKIEAWKSALNLCCTLALADAAIFTGEKKELIDLTSQDYTLLGYL